MKNSTFTPAQIIAATFLITVVLLMAVLFPEQLVN
jgi:hypothetical protein